MHKCKINYIQKPIGNDELVQIVNTIVANSITVDQVMHNNEWFGPVAFKHYNITLN